MTYGELLIKYVERLGRPVTAGEVVRDLRTVERIPWDHDCTHCLYQTENNPMLCEECRKDAENEQ